MYKFNKKETLLW